MAVVVVEVVGSAGESEISSSGTMSSPVEYMTPFCNCSPSPSDPTPSGRHPTNIYPNSNHSTLCLHILLSSLPDSELVGINPHQHNSTMSSSVYRRRLWFAPPEG
jgi:hypothetical protein